MFLEEYDAYFVLSIGETGFLQGTTRSSEMYPDGNRHIRADQRANEWKTPGKSSAQRQVVIALTGVFRNGSCKLYCRKNSSNFI